MIKHLCADHVINSNTETLIIGTFNPAIDINKADFFYGRSHNAMWTFLARAHGLASLKDNSKAEKIAFLNAHRIDFIDLIDEIGEIPTDYSDRLLDRQRKIVWRNVRGEIEKLRSLKRVCFSRKGFRDVPNIWKEVASIKSDLERRKILFRCLHTPARAHKRAWPEWRDFLKAC